MSPLHSTIDANHPGEADGGKVEDDETKSDGRELDVLFHGGTRDRVKYSYMYITP
jgi:hypothetical protein